MSALRYIAGAITTDFASRLSRAGAAAETGPWNIEQDTPLRLQVANGLPFYAGWYMVEFQASHAVTGIVKAKFDFLSDEDQEPFLISSTPGQLFKRVIRLDHRADKLSLEISAPEGQLTIDKLRLVPVTTGFAIKRLQKRVRAHSIRYVVDSNEALKQAICDEVGEAAYLDELYDHYCQLFDHNDYERWIATFEKPLFHNLSKLADESASLEKQPLISLLMPTYNTDTRWLSAAINSVREQVYPNWQLCIVDDASTDPSVRDLLEQVSSEDKRIKVGFHEQNQHIAATTNTALAMADGEFVGFLDHDDMLPKHALFAMAQAINDNPEVAILYSDEDKIDEENNRQSPYFKPGFNQDLLYSYNYFCHLTILRKDLMTTLGGLRTDVNGSQDFDLVLRAVANAGRNKVVHVPHVLYHWRMIAGSTAMHEGEKDYTSDAGMRALKDHLESTGQSDVEVLAGPQQSTYRLCRPLPQPAPLVSLIIPTRNGLAYLKACVDSILQKTTYPNYEILIVDNQSDDPATLEWMSEAGRDERIRVIRYDAPFNYSAINNYAVTQAKGDLIGLINNDIEVITPDWLSEMVSNVVREEVGCVGAKLLYDDGTLQHAGVVLGLGGVAGHAFKGFGREAPGYFYRAQLQQSYSAVTAACLLVRKSVFLEVGGLDEVDLRVAFNDVDFCLKVRAAGYDNVWTPWAELYHHESKSRGLEDTPEKIKRFQGEVAAMKLRWGRQLRHDPAYSQNLTLMAENFAIRG